MKLKLIKLNIDWHTELSLVKLRAFIIESLKGKGEPLRWSITSIKTSLNDQNIKCLVVEAVLIIADNS